MAPRAALGVLLSSALARLLAWKGLLGDLDRDRSLRKWKGVAWALHEVGMPECCDSYWSQNAGAMRLCRTFTALFPLFAGLGHFLEMSLPVWFPLLCFLRLAVVVVALTHPDWLPKGMDFDQVHHLQMTAHYVGVALLPPLTSSHSQFAWRTLGVAIVANYVCIEALDEQVVSLLLCYAALSESYSMEVTRLLAFVVVLALFHLGAVRGRTCLRITGSLRPSRLRRRLSRLPAKLSLIFALLLLALTPGVPMESRRNARSRASLLLFTSAVCVNAYFSTTKVNFARRVAQLVGVAVATVGVLGGVSHFVQHDASKIEWIALLWLPLFGVVLVLFKAGVTRSMSFTLSSSSALLGFANIAEADIPVVVQLQLLAMVLLFNYSIIAGRSEAENLVHIEANADSFVSHCLKQKFVGAGTAIEHAIQMGAKQPSLIEAWRECKFCSDWCHLSVVKRKLQANTIRYSTRSLTLAQAADEWRGSGGSQLQVSAYEIRVLRDTPPLVLNWELAWLMTFKLLGRRGALSLDFDPSDSCLLIHIEKRHPSSPRHLRDTNDTIAVFLAQLGGRTSGDSSFRIPCRIGAMRRIEELPKGLTVAVLDDNVLSRAMLWRFCESSLECSPQSFVRGTCVEEATAFAHEVIRVKPDLVIVDLNLEFPECDEHLLGTKVARDLRKLGYAGCIILHSANDGVPEGSESCDGVVSKTLSTARLVDGVARAWRRRCGIINGSQ